MKWKDKENQLDCLGEKQPISLSRPDVFELLFS